MVVVLEELHVVDNMLRQLGLHIKGDDAIDYKAFFDGNLL